MKHRDLARSVLKFGDVLVDASVTTESLANDFKLMAAMMNPAAGGIPPAIDPERDVGHMFGDLSQAITTKPPDGCSYCGNPSNLRDRRGMCVSCGGPYG